MVFNYYYGSEADQFNFIRIPKRLITDPLFADLSLSAKLLYCQTANYNRVQQQIKIPSDTYQTARSCL